MRKNEEEIKQDLINEDLNDILKGLISFLILSILFGYIGYIFCLANNYDVPRGIVFSILFALGISFLEAIDCGKIGFFIYIIIYFIVLKYIPTFIGITLIFILILLFITSFVVALKRDRTEEIKANKYEYLFRKNKTKTKSYINKDKSRIAIEQKNIDDELPIEKYRCERCFKEISKEEYELHDGMYEECFDESHYDSDGNYREDYWNY